jgi:hypothetical protein
MITLKQKIPPFNYRTNPYKHQHDEFVKSRELEYYGLFWEMGTGKSKPLVDTAAWLYLKQEIDGVLIVSDKGCYLNWEYEEIPKHMPTNIPYRIAHWSSHMRKKEVYRLQNIMTAKDDCLDILAMNIESFTSERAADVARRFLTNHYSLMIIDESTSIKNLNAARTNTIVNLGGLADYRRIATGTPITQSPLDLFSQCLFLKPGAIGNSSFVEFRSEYAILMLSRVKQGQRPYYQIVDFKNLDKLGSKIKKFSSRILKHECLDLPEKLYKTLYIEHTQSQALHYENMRRLAVTQFEQGLLTSVNALTLITKLMRIN